MITPYTDLEVKHIDELVYVISKKHKNPQITNLYPIYNDMVNDLKKHCRVNSTLHKKSVAVGALHKIFASSKNEQKNKSNIQIITNHEQTINHLLHEPVHPRDDANSACGRCRNSSCIIS